MDDTETTESQTNETNESQTDNTTNDTSSNSEPSFSSDALSNGNSGPGFDIDWSGWENSQSNKTNDNKTGDNDTSDDNREAAEAWVDMHQHTDWGSGLTVDDVFNNDNVDNGYNTGDDSTGDSTTDSTTETNNQSRTENQGDYDTSSKENSNVQTTTIGKQDEITTTPDTITENKGVISNSNIQSVEGLDFQQKDKDDLNSKKERDKAEAEDKSDKLKNELRADAEKNANANKDGKGFQVGNDYIDKTIKSYNDKQMANLNNQKADLDKQKTEARKNRTNKAAIELVSYKNRQDANKNLKNVVKRAEQAGNEVALSTPTGLGDSGANLTNEQVEEIISNSSESLGKYAEKYADALRNAHEKNQALQSAIEEYSKADAAVKEIDNKIDNINKTQAALEIVATDFRNGVKGIEDALKSGSITPEQAKNMINSLTSNAAYSKYGFDNKEIERSMGITKPETPAPETPATKEEPEIKEDTKVVPEELPPEEKGQELIDQKDPMKKAEELEDKYNAAKKSRENLENEIGKANQQKKELEENAKAAKENRENANTNLENVAKKAGINTNVPFSTIPTILVGEAALTEEEIEEIISDNSEALGKYAEEYGYALRDANEKNQIFQDVNEKYTENTKRLDDLSKGLEDAKKAEAAANKDLEDYRNEHNTDVIPEELPPEEKPAVPEEKPEEKGQELVDPTNPAQKAEDLANKANSLRNKNDYKDEEERNAANDLADSLDNLSASMKNATNASKAIVDENGKIDLNKCTPEQIETWEKSQAQLSKNLNDALSKSRAYEQHYGNKQFTRDIAKANDFKVPGTDKTYSELATEMATKSPQIAQAMYEAKANRYKEEAKKAADNGHKVSAWFNNTLSKIESIKSNMSQSLIGSKLTFADNKVRDQFNKMADLNMKATYAAYNNRLNHPEDYQPEDLEEARQQIDQAHALQYASAALKASTGALSGLGDSIKDGVYGTTNAKDLSGYQQVLADVGAFSQIVLGMGFTPLANKGYSTFNNLYPGSLFSKDIDKDGFAWTEEYGNNPAAEAILSVAQLSYGVSLVMNPMTFTNGITMIKNSIQNGLNAAYGVRNDARKLANLTDDITSYFEDVKEKPGIPPEAIPEIDNAINEIKTTTTTTEDFKVNSDEVGNLDNWLEGSGSNTADNSKFNQALKYEDWLKLIQADPAMKEYAKKLAAEKNKNAQENNADTRVNS